MNEMKPKDAGRMNESALPELPGGWVWTRLGEIISVHSGEGLASYQMDQSGIFPVYGGNGITGYHNKFMFEKSKLIIGRVGAKCGSVHMTLPKCWITDNALIVDFSLIDMKFLYYILGNLNLNRFSVSTAQPVISSRKIYPLMFGLPPFPEQRRIVTKIEELFTRLDAGVSELKKTQAQLKRYRQSVLKAACEGKLVPIEAELAKAEGREYEPADVLLSRILKERREKNKSTKYKEPAMPDTDGLPMLPEGWKWANVGQITEMIGSGITPLGGNKNYLSNGVLFIRSQNVQMMHLNLSDVAYVSQELHEQMSRTHVHFGDVLLNITGASIGRVAWFNLKDTSANVNQHVCILRLVQKFPEWVTLFLASSFGQALIMSKQSGATRQGLNYVQAKQLIIPLPPLAEQRCIVAEVERRLSIADGVEKTVAQSLAQAERLRQSILKKAFEGRLVAQDASDEPAGVLLERIKAEKMLRKEGKRKPKVY